MLNLKYVSLKTVDGHTIVGVLKELKDGFYQIINPFYFFIDYKEDGKPCVFFQKLNEFSDDEISNIRSEHVLSMNNLSEKYVGIYDEVVSGKVEESEPEFLAENEFLH